MCQSKAEGGRRCECTQASTNRHNYNRRKNNAAKAELAVLAEELDVDLGQSAPSDLATDDFEALVATIEEVLPQPSQEPDEAAGQAPAAAPKRSLADILADARAAADQLAQATGRHEEAEPWRTYGFADAGTTRKGWAPNAPYLEEESAQWVDDLSSGELDAIDEYTAEAYRDINKPLASGADVSTLSAENQDLVARIDAALDKAPMPDQPHVVYRGTRAYLGLSAREYADAYFAINSEVDFGSYLSTSHDPGVAARFSRRGHSSETQIVMEIATRRGAALVEISDVGNLEQERLLPRDTTAKVVGVHHDVPFEEADGTMSYLTVVQLVEASALQDPYQAPIVEPSWVEHGFEDSSVPRQPVGAGGGRDIDFDDFETEPDFDELEGDEADMRYADASAYWMGDLDEDEEEAVRDYVNGNDYKALNAKLRRSWRMSQSEQDMVERLDSALEMAGRVEPMKLYRGMTAPDGQNALEWAQQDLQVGSEITWPGYSSTSYDPSIAAAFAVSGGQHESSMVFEISSSVGAPTSAFSELPIDEREVLLPRDVSAKVVGIQEEVPFIGRDGSTTYLTVVQVVEAGTLPE